MTEPIWFPITDETKGRWGWDAPLVRLRDNAGREAIGSWGYEDENWDGDYWFAWHSEDGGNLGFEPTEFAVVNDSKTDGERAQERI